MTDEQAERLIETLQILNTNTATIARSLEEIYGALPSYTDDNLDSIKNSLSEIEKSIKKG
jgi:hypothetical protein